METAQPTAPPVGGDRPPGPGWRAVAVFVVAALALVATSAQIPTLDGTAIGEVVIGPSQVVERELRVHLDPAAAEATDGTISVGFQAASGLESGYAADATVGFVRASDAAGSFAVDPSLPLDHCTAGCDLVYTIAVTAAPTVLPGSVARYQVDVRLQYGGAGAAPPDTALRLELDGAATGPAVPIWAIVAGLLALVAGIAAGPWVDARLPATRRRWPALLALAIPLAVVGWILVERVTSLLGAAGLPDIGVTTGLLYLVGDPWSVGLLLTLAWGVWRGLRRWPEDGGWLLGVAAVALVGLGGLWWAWWTTYPAVIQPALLGLSFVVLGGVGGIVVGGAWGTDPRARHDRWWAAVGVLAHGVIIAGFGYLAEQSLFDPFAAIPTSLVGLIPMLLVAVAFGRWLYGRQRWLIFFDLVIAGIGVIGAWAWTSVSVSYTSGSNGLAIEEVAIGIAVLAAVVALVASLHTMPPRIGATPAPPDDAASSSTPTVSPAVPAAADPPTS